MLKETVQKLTPFIPQDLRLDILVSLWEEYRDSAEMADELGCEPALVDEWLKQGKAPDDNYMPQILSLGLRRSPRVRQMLRVDMLEEIESLLAQLEIFPEKKADGDLGKILDAVDERSRRILWHLWWNRHAEIGDLVVLTGAESDMEILTRLKESINPAARHILGKDIAVFESSRIDPVNGEQVLFSWWLEEDSLRGERTQPLMDIFEEDDHIAIIAQLPASLNLDKEAEIERKDGIVRIRIRKSQR